MTSMGHMGGGGAPPRFPGAEAFAAAVRRAAELAGTDDAAARRSLEATFPIDGAAVYRMNCRPCHGPRGAGKPPEIASILSHSRALSPSVQEDAMRRAGAQPSPDLARQLAEHADLTLRRRLKEGGAKASPPYLAEMPPFRHLSEAEIGALGDYLRRLAGVPAGSRPARAVESALRMGEHVARGTCLICHDGTGPGAGHSLLMAGRIPSLAVIPDHLSLEAVVHKTRHGWIEMSGIIHQKSRMPVFSYLSDEEVAAAYLYLLYLPPRE